MTRKHTSNKLGWLEGHDLNQNHVELFYWFLAILSVINFLNYLYWANWYKYKEDVPGDEELLLKSTNNPTSRNVDDSTVTASFVSSAGIQH